MEPRSAMVNITDLEGSVILTIALRGSIALNHRHTSLRRAGKPIHALGCQNHCVFEGHVEDEQPSIMVYYGIANPGRYGRYWNHINHGYSGIIHLGRGRVRRKEKNK